MAPLLRPRATLQKDKFATYFAPLNSQLYSDIPPSARGVQASIRSIAWNPLGNLVATGSSNKTLRVCECPPVPPYTCVRLTRAGNPEKANVRFSTELKGHAAAIQKVAFNPVKDGELASVSDDGVVKFWDVRTKNCINEVKGLGDAFTLVWSPDGESLIVGNKVSTSMMCCSRYKKTKYPARVTNCSSCHLRNPHLFHPTSRLSRQTRSPLTGVEIKYLSPRARDRQEYYPIPTLSLCCGSTMQLIRTTGRARSSSSQDIHHLV